MNRKEELKQALQSLKMGWSAVEKEIEARVGSLTESLIATENSEIRGRIKALLDLKDFPAQLESELKGIESELPERDSDFS
jgi:hypothetical protein